MVQHFGLGCSAQGGRAWLCRPGRPQGVIHWAEGKSTRNVAGICWAPHSLPAPAGAAKFGPVLWTSPYLELQVIRLGHKGGWALQLGEQPYPLSEDGECLAPGSGPWGGGGVLLGMQKTEWEPPHTHPYGVAGQQEGEHPRQGRGHQASPTWLLQCFLHV